MSITIDNNPKHDRGIRHRRRHAAFLLAKIGEDESIPILMHLLSQDHLEDFVKAGIVDALATIKHPRIPLLLSEILHSDNFPVDCKVRAAHFWVNNQIAKEYLLSLVADADADYFDRRDAAAALCDFKLKDNDIPILEKLLIDTNPIFWGGPNCAAKAIAGIGSSDAFSSLQKAYSIWESSDYNEKGNILNTIEEILALATQESDLEGLINRSLNPRQKRINFDLPKITFEFYRRKPDKATELFLKTLNEYDDLFIFGTTLAWAIIHTLPKLPLTKELINATVDLARRIPNDEMIWSILDRLWKRRDLDTEVRAAFFNEM